MPTPTLKAVQERFLESHRADGSSFKHIQHYEITFRDFERFLTATRRRKTVSVLTTETMQAFVAWLKETPIKPYRNTTVRSPVGINGHMKDLRAFVRWLREDEEQIDWKVRVPLPSMPKRHYPILSKDELAQLYEHPMLSGKAEANIRNRAIFGLLLDTGIRLAECATLRPKDIHPEWVTVIGKGDKQRHVPITPPVLELLQCWLAIRAKFDPTPDDPVFLLTTHGVGQVIDRLSVRTGINVFPHKIRHTACTLMLLRGMDLHTVSKIMGHSQVSTTQTYLSLLPEDIAAKHAPASPFLAMQETIAERKPEPVRRRRKLKEDVA